MEESEKRRERLQSQRMDSASPAPCSSYSSPPPVHLSNPRFDSYTDPTPAFSGPMRGSGGGGYNPPENFSSPIRSAASPISHPSSSYQPSAGPRSYHMAAPAHQFRVNQPPRHCSYGTPPPVPGSASWRSPVPFVGPLSGPGVSPIANPGFWNRSGGGSPGHGFPPSSSRAGFMSPGFGRGGSPTSISSSMSPGIGGGGSPMSYSGGSRPHNFYGRGRGWQCGGSPSPSPGRTGGRGARQEAGRFYGKYMVEDPWRGMRPIVGNILVPLAGPDFWLPKSITAKKAKITESVEEFNSHLSLAECLALSFEEAVTDLNA